MQSDSPNPAPDDNEEYWRNFLSQPDTWMRFGRRVFTHLPSEPRCRMCTAPFSGPGGPLMRLIGKRQSRANPSMCTACEDHMLRHHGGAEVEAAMLFADIRGSTALAESMSTADFHGLLNRFYSVASQAVFKNDGVVDKFVGDELVAAFHPYLGRDYVARAVDAARAVLRATGHGSKGGPWVPVGGGVHAGTAWFGAIGEGTHVELTAVGDAVNTTARLAAAAGPGEILVSLDAAEEAGLGQAGMIRKLELKGKSEPVEVVVLGVASAGAQAS